MGASSFPRSLRAFVAVALVPTALGVLAGRGLHTGDARAFWGALVAASAWFVVILWLEPRLRRNATARRATALRGGRAADDDAPP